MPTPFSHMVAISHLLTDPDVPPDVREALAEQRPAFVLGSVAPDARPDAEDPRLATHFYSYMRPFDKAPWRIMLDEHPQLAPPQGVAHRAFLAGYVAHLAMDEVWTVDMLAPHFANGDWGDGIKERFFVLHLLLIDMDDRDALRIPAWAPDALQRAAPTDWLPFIPQDVLVDWQQLIGQQIVPGGSSKTLEIFGGRVDREPEQLRELVDDADWMQRELWAHVSPAVLTSVEQEMYEHARDSLVDYWREFGG